MSSKKKPQKKPSHLKAVGEKEVKEATDRAVMHDLPQEVRDIINDMPPNAADLMLKDPDQCKIIIGQRKSITREMIIKQVLVTNKDDLIDVFIRHLSVAGTDPLISHIVSHWMSYAKPEDMKNVAMAVSHGQDIVDETRNGPGSFYSHFKMLAFHANAEEYAKKFIEDQERRLKKEKEERIEAERKALEEEERKRNPKLPLNDGREDDTAD